MLTIQKVYDIEDLTTDHRFLQERATLFTFPQTLGALFFGASLVVFYSTFKHIAHSRLVKPRKISSFVILDIVLILGILAHVFDVNDASMYTSSYSYSGRNFINISVGDDHTQYIPKLHGFIVIFTGWVAAFSLVIRAHILTGRKRWFAILSSFLLLALFVAQIVLYLIGFRAAFPAYPTVNLLIQIPVTLAVLHNAFTRNSESKKGVLCVIEDVLTDSGALLTVGLILQTVFPFAGVSFEPINALLPHLQNITTCIIFNRLVDGDAANGALRLTSEESVVPVTGRTSP